MRILAALAFLLLPGLAGAEAWYLDSDQTSIKVKVGYAGSRGVTVDFQSFGGVIDFSRAHPEQTSATIKVASRYVDTGLGLIDNLVRSEAYLDADGHAHITFKLDRLVPTSDQTADIHGRITLRGVTHPISFTADVFRYGPREGAEDVFEAGFNLTGQIDRRDFGSTAGQPEVSSILPINIRLVMTSKPT